MEPRYIAAIEIGSSKIKGIVASVDPSSAITIVAVEESDAGDSVRYGRVQNAREAASRVNDIIRRLENNPRLAGARITHVYVPEGGRSVESRQVSADVHLGGDIEITAQVIEKLHNEARYNMATDRDVLAVSNRRFVVDGAEVRRLVGSFGNAVHGEFTFVTASPENRRNLNRVKIESRGLEIPRRYIPRAVALADMVMSDSERQLGTLLIDLGAETTTVAVYRGSALMLLGTLPMGSANITRDLANGLGVTHEEAEKIKLSRGRAVAERVKNAETDPETAEITDYVSARTGEIIANIMGYIDRAGIRLSDLPGGIVLAGGGAHLGGLAEMLQAQTDLKVRKATVDSSIIGEPFNTADHIDVISLVRYAAREDSQQCIEFPEASASAPYSGGRRQLLDDNDPRLLVDDMDEETITDELPPEGPDADSTRETLLNKIKYWFTKPKDTDLDGDEGELD